MRWQDWQRIVSKLHGPGFFQAMHEAGERSPAHLYLGQTLYHDSPAFLHVPILHEHGWILGDAGSGKTSKGLAPLIAQLVRLAPVQLGRGEPAHSVAVVDLKGDPALFHGVREEAARAGLPLRWFTTQPGCSSHVFNPFLQSFVPSISIEDQAQGLLQSLGLEHGEGYGPLHFSLAHKRQLVSSLHARPDVDSFHALHEALAWKTNPRPGDATAKRRATGRDSRESEDLQTLIHELSQFPALNVSPSSGEHASRLSAAIDMPALFRTPQVLYFYLPVEGPRASNRRIARLALYSLLQASGFHDRTRDERKCQLFLFVDEFQEIADESLVVFFQQARSKGIATVVSNQTTSDLQAHRMDLFPTVWANTRFKQFFAASDTNLQDVLMKASGEASYRMHGYTVEWPDEDLPATMNEYHGPLISRDDLIDMTDAPEQSCVLIQRSSGLSQFRGRPFMARSSFHIPAEEFERRQRAPWPAQDSSTLLNDIPRTPRQPARPAVLVDEVP